MPRFLSIFNLSIISILILGNIGISAPVVAATSTLLTNIDKVAVGDKDGGPYKTGVTDPALIIGKIIKIVVGLIGVILLVLIVYAGYLWMTAGGNEEQLKQAKGILVNSIIGVIIVLMAYIITYFVVNELAVAVQ